MHYIYKSSYLYKNKTAFTLLTRRRSFVLYTMCPCHYNKIRNSTNHDGRFVYDFFLRTRFVPTLFGNVNIEYLYSCIVILKLYHSCIYLTTSIMRNRLSFIITLAKNNWFKTVVFSLGSSSLYSTHSPPLQQFWNKSLFLPTCRIKMLWNWYCFILFI